MTRVGIRLSILRDGMSLKEYGRKRSFKKTPEPEPRVQSTAGGNYFCVQRHDATRLHYDFRLEVDGTLKSWAVPKGPSLEPLAKHLAMHVEDHPLDYGSFEGNIPKGEYGGGSVMLWDRGSYELLGDAPALAQIERGDFKFRLHGEKLRGEFALVLMRGRGKGNEWLLIKKNDADAKPGWNIEDYARSVLTGRTQQEIAEDLPARQPAATSHQQTTTKPGVVEGAVQLPMPHSVSPMLATIATKPPTGDAWLYEVKWDGVRALCFVDLDQADSQLRIFSRTQKRCEQQYPELSVLPRKVKASQAILDGEIAVLDDQGRSSFSLIQPRISVADANAIAHLSRSIPVHLFLFDLLYLDGYDLRGAPLDERKRLLAEIVTPSERIHVSDFFTVDGHAMLEAARANGLEGIVAKVRASRYEGRRSRDWLKIKINSTDEFVIGGFTHGERDYFSSLVLGRYDGDKLVHAGQVGTGFNEKSLKEIYDKLEPLITKKSPFSGTVKALRDVTWVRPELVAEIKYLEFTPDRLLRAPVFVALRTDKDPKEAQGDQEYKGTRGIQGGQRTTDPHQVTRRSDARNRRASPQADESQQGILSRRRREQARRHQLLRRGSAADSAAFARPAAFAQTLPERHRRAVLLSKRCRGQSAGLGAAGTDFLGAPPMERGRTRFTTSSATTAQRWCTSRIWQASTKTHG